MKRRAEDSPAGRENSCEKSGLETRFIFITGGVSSSLGKGIAAASIGAIMKAARQRVFFQKLDPYLNVDSGTMNPFQHGEVFVTDDGAETDLDIGHYERFVNESLTRMSSITAGQVFRTVLDNERRGEYLGGTVQYIPHVTDTIKERMHRAAKESKADIVIVEVGGTVGDIEGAVFLEAIRQLRSELGPNRTCHVHMGFVPHMEASDELKTKPMQHSVIKVRESGLQPDMILARADRAIPMELLDKISLFCGVRRDAVIPAPTLHSIYDVPLYLEQEHHIAEVMGRYLGLTLAPDMSEWEEGRRLHEEAQEHLIPIALVGKYLHVKDAYLSVYEAIRSAAVHHNHKADIMLIDSEELESAGSPLWEDLKRCAGIVVPGGFGSRGVEGKMAAARFARTQGVPYLGLCLGAQLMVIDFARDVLKDGTLTSQEFDEKKILDPSKYVVHFLPGQHEGKEKGGTLRLGAYTCAVQAGTKAFEAYGRSEISERHRHRYEFNNDFRVRLEKHGLVFSGIWPETGLAEIVEVEGHPFMVGTQFHPEFKSRPHHPHPMFAKFAEAALACHAGGL
ncbi:CTP synthase [Candidatus Peregrinibacteria bacterium]|nr:CTP synthase [Candidatus Peregrinibacteria bacterium]